MKAAKIISTLLGLFLSMPIWFYLLYKILEAVHASELMWFLYWVYVPLTLMVTAIIKIVDND